MFNSRNKKRQRAQRIPQSKRQKLTKSSSRDIDTKTIIDSDDITIGQVLSYCNKRNLSWCRDLPITTMMSKAYVESLSYRDLQKLCSDLREDPKEIKLTNNRKVLCKFFNTSMVRLKRKAMYLLRKDIMLHDSLDVPFSLPTLGLMTEYAEDIVDGKQFPNEMDIMKALKTLAPAHKNHWASWSALLDWDCIDTVGEAREIMSAEQPYQYLTKYPPALVTFLNQLRNKSLLRQHQKRIRRLQQEAFNRYRNAQA